jgi:ABC-type transport system involved in Fe-S cluster assembly fused permease/ATPase subunit
VCHKAHALLRLVVCCWLCLDVVPEVVVIMWSVTAKAEHLAAKDGEPGSAGLGCAMHWPFTLILTSVVEIFLYIAVILVVHSFISIIFFEYAIITVVGYLIFCVVESNAQDDQQTLDNSNCGTRTSMNAFYCIVAAEKLN